MKIDLKLPSRIFRYALQYYQEMASAKRYSVGFYNFWEQKTPKMWLYQFLLTKGLLPKAEEKKMAFFSVFGPRFKMNLARVGVKVFYTGENVQAGPNRRYRDHALRKKMDLSIGFEYLSHEKYYRFPLWMMAAFPPSSSEQDIQDICAKMTHPEVGLRPQFASLIARHDSSGLRQSIYHEVSKVGRVDCDGAFLHNNDVLKLMYNDDKIRFLTNYMFNICPENSNTNGYVTEKIFDAILAGCIPIYWGSDNRPEPGILNQDAILFWNSGANQDELAEKVNALFRSKTLFKDFSSQPRLLPKAAEQIIEAFRGLENRFRELLA